jgi:CIC family chloride channel protein
MTGAAIGSNIARTLRMNYRQTTLLLGCGVAAALSAIFKAPITGVVFVLEILMLDITTSAIISLLISSVTATTLILILTGFEPLFTVKLRETFAIGNLPYYALLGMACGLLSYYFKRINRWIAGIFAKIDKQYKRWILGGTILGVLIFVFPPLYGEGYEAFDDLMHGNIESLFNNSMFFAYRDAAWVVVIYLVAILFFKVIAMAATNASGGVGGTFAPSLFVGAFAGGAMAYVCNHFFALDLPIAHFTLVGMAGVMAGVMNAPLTSIFLIAELSNGYTLFIPLMLVASLAFAIGYYFDPYSIYTRKLQKQGELLTHNKDKSVMVFLDLPSLMETDFHPIAVDATLGDMVRLISRARRNIFPVVDNEGVLLGIVQLDDLRSDMFSSEKYGETMDKYMIPPPDIIYRNERMESILNSFEQSKAWMLPVIDRRNKYLGFISKSRILDAYRQQLVEISEE